ncbi:MAG: hypothetical protein IJT82_08930 [Schwartzia sp.]|nr:hypothetical protein [Schwartzia sp. (in: firmicutes)]
MENKFSVAISFDGVLGYIEYDGDRRDAAVTLPNDEARAAVEKYLRSKHRIQVPNDTLLDFSEEEIDPMESVRSFQIALTRMWEENGVHVDWSRPVEFVKKYPTLDSLPKGGVPFTLDEN